MKKLMLMAAGALIFASCTNDDVPAGPGADGLTDAPVVVRAGVDELVTRAGMTTTDLSSLGLSILNPASDAYSYTNVEYVKTGGSFATAAGVATPLWQNAEQEVTVTAYSPYNASWGAGEQTFAVMTDQSTADAAKASDLLWAQAAVTPSSPSQTGDITYSGRALNIRLQHKMSKLIVNLRYMGEIGESVAAESLTVKYLSAGCTIDTADGSIVNLDPAADITAYRETGGNAVGGLTYKDCFEAIFPPQTMAFKLVILLDDGRDFIYHNPAFEFHPDIAYTLNLAVGKDKVVIADSGITAEDWGIVAGGRLETDDL